jgi:hypothetical protein
MDKNFIDRTHDKWTKAGGLPVDFSSFGTGFHIRLEREKYREEIWDYLQYRESLLRWPSINEEIKRG